MTIDPDGAAMAARAVSLSHVNAMRCCLPTPPIPKRRPTTLTAHGETRLDFYYWLRDRDPDVMAYLEAENAYAEAMLADTADLQRRLYEEFLSHIAQTDSEVAVRYGPWCYYSRTVAGYDYPLYCRRQGEDGPEQIYLDVNALAAGHEYFHLGGLALDPAQRYLAWQADTRGDEAYTLRIRDLERGEDLAEEIPATHAGVVWASDGLTVLYVVEDETRRPYQVWRHRLGAAPAEDALVYEEEAPGYFVKVARTKDWAYLLIESATHATSETRILPAGRPEAPAQLVVPRQPGVEYEVEHRNGRLLLLTNQDALNFRLLASPPAPKLPASDLSDWHTLIAHEPAVKLEGIETFARHLVVYIREQGVTGVRVGDDDGWHSLAFEEALHTVDGGWNPEYHSHRLRLTYTSLVTPERVYDYDMAARRLTLLREQPVPGDYNPAEYESWQQWAVAPDGRRIPVSMVARRDRGAGPSPMVLYAYGAYGISLEPEFSPTRVSLLDRGVIWAIAHVRGGGELGEGWYRDGKLLAKPHTFSDCIAVAEALIGRGHTTPERLALMGASAGGMLVGAVLNERPELFAAAVAEVPFVDVLTSMLDPTLPLTVIEYDEWGDPQVPEVYACIRSYSPVDNVRPQSYPHLLVMAGLNDPRVPYWEPAKWVARLRATKTGGQWLLLHTQMGAGHGGASGRYEALREVAMAYAFILDRLGIAGEVVGNG